MRIAFLTYRSLPQLSDDDRLAVAELRHHDIAVESAVWDSPLVDWSVYDALVIRSVWDYHLRPREFETWLALVERLGVPLWNPASLVRWNMDKRYLTARARIDELSEHEAAFSSLLAERDVLVQPFMEQIVTDGEWSRPRRRVGGGCGLARAWPVVVCPGGRVRSRFREDDGGSDQQSPQ